MPKRDRGDTSPLCFVFSHADQVWERLRVPRALRLCPGCFHAVSRYKHLSIKEKTTNGTHLVLVCPFPWRNAGHMETEMCPVGGWELASPCPPWRKPRMAGETLELVTTTPQQAPWRGSISGFLL